MNFKAVIFDLDGTLVNSLQDIGDSCNQVLTRHGLPTHPTSAYPYFIGDGIAKLVERALPEAQRNPQDLAAYTEQVREVYSRNWNIKTRPYPGILELLSTLADMGVRLAVLSNKPHEATLEVVNYFFPQTSFANISGAKPEVPLKPDPAGAVAIAAELELAGEECIFVGDSVVDIKTALASGMYPAGAGWGFRPEVLDGAGARSVLGHPRELLELY